MTWQHIIENQILKGSSLKNERIYLLLYYWVHKSLYIYSWDPFVDPYLANMNNWTYTIVRVTRRIGPQLLLNYCLNPYKYARTSKLEHKVQKRIQFWSRETLHFHFHSCWARPRKSQRHSLANCRHCWPKLQLTVRKSTGHVQKGQRDFPISPGSLLLNLSPLLTPLPLSFSGYLTPAHRLSISTFPFPNLRILSSILPLLGSLSIAHSSWSNDKSKRFLNSIGTYSTKNRFVWQANTVRCRQTWHLFDGKWYD